MPPLRLRNLFCFGEWGAKGSLIFRLPIPYLQSFETSKLDAGNNSSLEE